MKTKLWIRLHITHYLISYEVDGPDEDHFYLMTEQVAKPWVPQWLADWLEDE